MKRPIRKIAFVSPHCVIDFTNGAATATLDALALLARSGFECQAFCSARMDACEEVVVDQILARRGLRYVVRKARIGRQQGRMIFTAYENAAVTLFNSASTRGGWLDRDEVAAFLSGCEIFLRRNRPDLVWTYGGDPVCLLLHRLVRGLGIPILFGLHNFNYPFADTFRLVDHVVVPSEFARRHYRQALGLNCHRLPYVIDPVRVRVAESKISNLKSEISNKVEIQKGKMQNGPHPNPLPEGEGNGKSQISNLRFQKSPHPNPLPEGEGKYVTFVNPQAAKGLYFFARLAEVLARRRPEIPLLVVEGRNGPGWKEETGIDLSRLPNVTVRPNTVDPRTFYADSKILLVPSLWNESFGLVAAEAMLNGIPVLASNRGALPETLGNSPHPNPLPEGEGTIRPHPNLEEDGNGKSQISNLKFQNCPEREGTSGGFLFDIPARYTPETRDLPTAEEVAPWVETIIGLWDDADEYGRRSRAAREHARQWSAESLAETYVNFFGKLLKTREQVRLPSPPAPLPRQASFPARLGSGKSQISNLKLKKGPHPGPLPEGEGSQRPSAAAKPLVTCKWLGRSGRLGNQMFQIAATIGTARKNGLEFVFPQWAFADYFQRPVPQAAQLPDTEVYWEPTFAYQEIRVCRPTNLAGCFQSERYFEHCAEEVRGYFSPRAELVAILQERFGELLSRPTCSVHVRRGDYVGDPNYVDLAATDYYERAVARLAAETTFLFFSDDIDWCQKRFRDRRFAFIKGQSNIGDLFLMSLCRDHIIANSSFSWWGAWLDGRPGKTVIAPARWFGGNYAQASLPFSTSTYQGYAEGSLPFSVRTYHGYHDTCDLIPAGWIRI